MNKKPFKHKFKQDAYDRADYKAKQTIINYLKPMNYTKIDSEENYSFDLMCYASDKIHSLHEVEIKHGWKNEWPDSWKEIRLPHRKNRLLRIWKQKYPNSLLSFYILRNDCKKAWHIDGSVLENCEVKPAFGRNITKGELFFHILVKDATLIENLNYENSSS